MVNIVYEFVIPNLLFFAVVFVAFAILETVIVLLLVFLEDRYHDQLMVLTLKSYKYYRRVQVIFTVAGLALLIAACWYLLPFLDYTKTRPEIGIFAVALFVVISLLYFLLSILKGQFSVRKSSNRILFLALSIILYFSTLLFIDQEFPAYRRYVYKNLIIPAVADVQDMMATRKKDALLNTFRTLVRQGLCPFRNYKDGVDTNVIHNFIYVTTDLDLKTRKGPSLPFDPNAIIQGKNCTNGTDTFLLTDNGAWYWVMDTAK